MSKKARNGGGFGGQGPNALWFLMILLAAGMMYLFWYNSINHDIHAISYSQLVKSVESNKVASLAIQDQHVRGKFKDDAVFETYVIITPQLLDLLQARQVEVEVYPKEKQPWGTYLLFMILLFSLLPLLIYLRQSQNGGGGSGKIFSVGKSKARFFSPNTITVTFKDVAGVVEAKEDLKDIVEFLKNPERFERLGAKIPRGVLLSGAPGNGKTLLAKAVAGEASCPFFSISGSDFVEVFVGVGASRVRDLFAQARRHSPCIVFIDEIDAVGRQRGVGLGGGNDEREQTLNQLLSEMDGFSTEHGAVIVLAATNRPDVLDKALLRPGRFDRNIEVPFPDLSAREEILRVHVRNVKLDPAVDIKKIARGTPGFSGADLENLINESALMAAKDDGEHTIKLKHFERARDKIMLGAERKTLIQTPAEKMLTAYHEAGHSLLNVLLPATDPFHKVTIIPRGRTLGVSWSLPEKDRVSHTQEELESRIMVSLGGLLGEEMKFGCHSTGVASDLENASNIARGMVTHYGMSDLGPIVFEMSPNNSYGQHREFSENTAERIDNEVKKIMDRCFARGKKLLEDNRDRHELLAVTLAEKETLHAAEVYALLNIEPRETHSLDDETPSASSL